MYAVVEFTDGLEVEVIPSAWLTENKKKAYWPMWRNMTKVQSAIKQCLKPGADYMCLDIRVLYESDNFDKARSKLANAVMTSSLETTDGEDASREEKGQKRKKRPNPKYNNLSSSEDEEDDDSTQLKKLRRSLRKNIKSFPDLPPLPELPIPVTPQPSPSSSSSSSLPKQNEPKRRLISSPSTAASPRATPEVSTKPRVSATDIKIISIIEDIKGQVRFNTKLLQNILAKVEVAAPVAETDQTLDIGIDFPLKTLNNLDALEEQLEDSGIVRALLPNLTAIGGDSLQSSVRRLLSFLMTNDLAQQINWKGKGKKRGFSALKLKPIVLKAVRKNRFCAQATEADVEKVIKDWLRYSADRDGGRKRRAEKKKENARTEAEADESD